MQNPRREIRTLHAEQALDEWEALDMQLRHALDDEHEEEDDGPPEGYAEIVAESEAHDGF